MYKLRTITNLIGQMLQNQLEQTTRTTSGLLMMTLSMLWKSIRLRKKSNKETSRMKVQINMVNKVRNKARKSKIKRRKMKSTLNSFRTNLSKADSQNKTGDWASIKNSAPPQQLLLMQRPSSQEEVMILFYVLDKIKANGNSSIESNTDRQSVKSKFLMMASMQFLLLKHKFSALSSANSKPKSQTQNNQQTQSAINKEVSSLPLMAIQQESITSKVWICIQVTTQIYHLIRFLLLTMENK